MLSRCIGGLLILFLLGCSNNPDRFSKESLGDLLLDQKGNELSWEDALSQMKGSVTVIDFWATWCGDCIEGFNQLNQLKEEYPKINVAYVSLDKNQESWLWGIQKYNLDGKHYFLKNGKNGELGDFLNLWWIPRYVVIDENNNIFIFKATKANDIKIKNILQ